jgi:hypothetical protein
MYKKEIRLTHRSNSNDFIIFLSTNDKEFKKTQSNLYYWNFQFLSYILIETEHKTIKGNMLSNYQKRLVNKKLGSTSKTPNWLQV